MTLKTKTILFASLIVAMILPLSVVTFADAQNVNEETEKTNAYDIDKQMQSNQTYRVQIDETVKQEFKNDIRSLLDYNSKEFQARTDEIKTKYDEFFGTVIEQSRIESNTRVLTDTEIKAAKEYIFYETIKDERHKALQEQDTDNIDVNWLGWPGIQTVSAACPSTTPPSYKQLKLDIDGGKFKTNSFNGNNDLYLVSYKDNSKTCERTYTLYFKDEDHPTIDEAYDKIRLIMYKRTHDIEMFSIYNNDKIKFDNTWSSTNNYVCGAGSFDTLVCHGTKTKTYIPAQTVYVSNTWNHMMDTSDTNPIYSKVTVP